MADLNGSTIATTYSSLLKFDDNGTVETDTVQVISDGRGTDTSLSLSTQRATITLGSGPADDFIVDGTTLVVEGDNNRVGIGTAAPLFDLHVESSSANNPYIVLRNVSTSSQEGGNFIFDNGDSNSNLSDNTVLGEIVFRGRDASDGVYITAAKIGSRIDGATGTDDMPAELFFETNNTANDSVQTMCILGNGNVGIGDPAPEQQLHVKSSGNCMIDIDASDDAGIMFSEDDNLKWTMYNDATNDRIYITDVEGDDGMYMTQGAADWADASDERLKTSITPIENAVDKLKTLQSINFKWKYGSEDRKARNNIGLLAQELQKVVPEAVDVPTGEFSLIDHPSIDGEKKAENAWGVQYSRLVPVLVKAVQELSASNDALKARIDVLEG